MSQTIVALDCMGGDNAPGEIVKGGIEALKESKDVFLKMVGRQEDVNRELEKYDYDKTRVEVVNATEVIETGEPPVVAIRTKKDSSLVKCMYMVKHGECDALVSAGSTGATLVGGHVIVGRIKGVERPPLAPLIPTEKGGALLIDCGANVDAKPSNLVQFAQMGSIYMENICKVKNPKVGLVNIGAEEEKGNNLAKETYQLLSNLEGINFIGNIEARAIPEGKADVVVCDAFVGNVILKMYEGVGGVLLKKVKGTLMTSLKTKIGALLIKKELKETLKTFPELQLENMIAPQNAQLTWNGEKFDVTREKVGNQIDLEEAEEFAIRQINAGMDSIYFQLVTQGNPDVVYEDIESIQKYMNNLLQSCLYFKLANGEIVTLDKNVIKTWIVEDARLGYLIDVESGIQHFVEMLAQKVKDINKDTPELTDVELNQDVETEIINAFLGNPNPQEVDLAYRKIKE